ncbi:MAG: segregation/condensation protein A [Gammaproteobacteria bacterium]|jgi:segregation and condensation protein A|nr:segregation/condensation protein A [Gammaproteobacteria bacterium]
MSNEFDSEQDESEQDLSGHDDSGSAVEKLAISADNDSPQTCADEAESAVAEDHISADEEQPEQDLNLKLVNKVRLLVEAREHSNGGQEEMPFAFVAGQAMTDLPRDLYIPPDALEVFLEAFEGPLDLLLYLIKRQNIDILNINVSEITDQYIAYVELMEAAQFELAAEYLVMAAMLAEIKSRILLPRTSNEEDEEEDPRAQLIRRLQEYERFMEAAESLDEYPRLERDIHLASAEAPVMEKEVPLPDIDLKEILQAFATVLRRSDLFEHHHIQRDSLSTREKMSQILLSISDNQFVPMLSLLRKDEGRMGVVVTFLAVMELIKEAMIEIAQSEPFGPIHIKARTS